MTTGTPDGDGEVVEVFTGDTLEEAMAAAVAALGPALTVRRARKVRAGVRGLLGRDRYEVLAVPPDGPTPLSSRDHDDDDADPVGSALEALLEAADEREAGGPAARPVGRPSAARPLAARPVSDALPPPLRPAAPGAPAPLPPAPRSGGSPLRRRRSPRTEAELQAPAAPGAPPAEPQALPSAPTGAALAPSADRRSTSSGSDVTGADRTDRTDRTAAPRPAPVEPPRRASHPDPAAPSRRGAARPEPVEPAFEERRQPESAPGAPARPARRRGRALDLSLSDRSPHPDPGVADHPAPAPPVPTRSAVVDASPRDPQPGEQPPSRARDTPAAAKTAPPAAAPGRRRRTTGWSADALAALGVPGPVLDALPDDAPADDLAWVVALTAAIAATVPAPSEPDAQTPVVVSGHGLPGAVAVLDAGCRGLAPGTISHAGRTAPATATELALVLRHHVTGGA